MSKELYRYLLMGSTVQTISRPTCVLTGVEDLEIVYSFKNFPVYVGCTTSNSTDDLFCDMTIGHSKSSGSLQLMNLIDPSVLYKYNHGSGTVGNVWKEHHKKFYNFISKHQFNKVLEIGGASGSLIRNFLETDKTFNWTIIEPSDAQPIDDPRVQFISNFFENYQNDNPFDTIIHSHLLEHVYNPMQFLNKVYNKLENNGNHFLTFPNMKHYLKHGFTNALLFEHTYYIDENIAEYMLTNANFEIIETIVEEHSIFIHCKKSKNIIAKNISFDYTKKLYVDYVNNLKEDVTLILARIKNSNVFLFGAHIFSQILLNLGLPEKQVISILDNDPKKHDKRLYGSDLYVKSPSCLKDIASPIVIVRSGVYTKEIKESLLKINPSIIFI